MTAALRLKTAKSWGTVRPLILLVLPVVFLVLAIGLTATALRQESTNATVRDLLANKDIVVDVGARPAVLLARIKFLLDHDRVDEMQPFVEQLDRSGDDDERAVAHYDFANGLLRQGFDMISESQLEKAGPFVTLARAEYRRALTFAPSDWDAKFNLDVASRLIRDFPAFERTIGDTLKTDRKKIWTDIPGKPEGLP
jgi:mxaK protein